MNILLQGAKDEGGQGVACSKTHHHISNHV